MPSVQGVVKVLLQQRNEERKFVYNTVVKGLASKAVTPLFTRLDVGLKLPLSETIHSLTLA